MYKSSFKSLQESYPLTLFSTENTWVIQNEESEEKDCPCFMRGPKLTEQRGWLQEWLKNAIHQPNIQSLMGTAVCTS